MSANSRAEARAIQRRSSFVEQTAGSLLTPPFSGTDGPFFSARGETRLPEGVCSSTGVAGMTDAP